MESTVLFSIIIVTLNAEKEILTTIKSINEQNYNDYEIIVKDGGSKDRTLKLLPQNTKCYIYCEKDLSVYDGMNQAVKYAKGKFVIFMNAGDSFYNPEVLNELSSYIYKNNLVDSECVLYGNYCRKGEYIQNQPVNLTPFYLYRRPLCHQSIFYSKKLFEIYGLYDLKYKISADHDLNMRFWLNQVPFYHSGLTICNYIGGGISESDNGWKKALVERAAIRKNNYTLQQQLKYNLIIALSFSKLRAWLDSNKSPRILSNVYIMIRNFILK